ncbi:hypothetical protein LBMAG55_04600 [Verrucomicrobiota bacterium]|nr:hypothetical protein LBMAG55_04600 [Verrucomicrobiota bacterium]
MRISRTTVILLVANLLAFGLVWKATYVHRPTTETPDLVFAAAGAKLELTDEGRTLTLERRNSVWRVTAPFDWPANLWTVQRLQDELRFIGADKGFPVEEAKANGEGLAAYGLATPRWTLKVTGEAGTVTEVKIGLMPSTRKCYLLTEDRRRIIPLPEAMTAALEIKPEAYRVDKVFEVTDFEARAVSVRRGPGEEVFSLVSETRARVGVTASGPEWRFEAPFDTLADAESAPKAVADLTNLRVLRFVNATEAETGLANPVLRIAIEGSARRQALLLGKPANEKGDQRFAKLEDNVALFVVDAPALQTWSLAVPRLLSSRPAAFDAPLVTGFTLSHEGRSLTLRRLDAGAGGTRWEIPVVPGSTATKRREADRTQVGRFLQDLSALRAIVRPVSAPAAPGSPEVLLLPSPPPEPRQKLELEFGNDRLTLLIADAPAPGGAGLRLVYAKDAKFGALCDVSLLAALLTQVEPQGWRDRAVMQLPQGAKVSGLRLTDRADGKVLGEARLAPNGSWTGSGRLDAATARRVAEAMAEVTATEFPTRDLGAGDWKYELRVTDQAAAGAGGAAESLRTYLLAAPIGAHNLLVRDDADTDAFLLVPIRADILIPLLEAGK